MRATDSEPILDAALGGHHSLRPVRLWGAALIVLLGASALSPAEAQGIYGYDDASYGLFASPAGRSQSYMPSSTQRRASIDERGRSWQPGGNYVYPPTTLNVPRPSVNVGAGYGGTGYRAAAAPGGVYGAAAPSGPRGNITVQTYRGAPPAPVPSAAVYQPPATEDASDDYDYDYDSEDAPLPIYRAASGGKGPDPKFNRQMVRYTTNEPAGTIIIDTGARFLYLVQGGGKAVRYGIGVGREGFGWTGTQRVSRKAEWPDWRPPQEMIQRRPDLPNYMPGGEDNPLGARALYLGDSLYRIHGSNEPETIGQAVSSGCFRMRNPDVIDLYNRVGVGTVVKVI